MHDRDDQAGWNAQARVAQPAQGTMPETVGPGALSTLGGLGVAAGLAAGLTACGGGVAPFEPMTPERAARLLNQGGLGATPQEVANVVQIGGDAWFDAQLTTPVPASVYDWAVAHGYANGVYSRSDYGLDQALWWRLCTAPDVLRQRVVLALSEIFVVSPLNMVAYWRQFGCLAWWELLEQHCFGNFRDLLTAIATSPAMGVYLSLRGSAKEDDSGRRPDENFARELLQLFTIGQTPLNLDGSPLPGGADTYNADTITQLARVFTGWDVDGFNPFFPDGPFDYWRQPMNFHPERHSTGDKTLLGITIPGGTSGTEAMASALDAIFRHPNVAPFIARQLIQRLVTSNPSAAYVFRVAAVFENNGASTPVRGDMASVIRAVLSDVEARPEKVAQPAGASNVLSDGKLREPVIRLLQWLRLTQVSSPDDTWNFPDLSGSDMLGQAPMRSPSVFNFFRPGYVPPATEIAQRGLVAPEFQITNESTVIGYVNFLRAVMPFGGAGIKPNYEHWLSMADDVPTLVDQLDLHLTGRMLSPDTLSTIVKGVQSITGASSNERLNRVVAAFLLMMCAPEYLVQR